MVEKIIHLPPEQIETMKQKSWVRRFLEGITGRGRIAGAVTPFEPTVEAAQKIGELGGAVISRSHATGVVIPKFDKEK